jgi:hypothetical protein
MHFQACFLELIKYENHTLLQFDVQEEQEEPSFDIMQEMKSMVQRLMQFVRVDPTVFHPQEHRLTAEFCREKIYL